MLRIYDKYLKKLKRFSPEELHFTEQKFKQFNVKDHLKELNVNQIRSWQNTRAIPYSVAVYNTIRDFNLSSVIRNASAFAFKEVNIIGHRKYDRRGAVGAYKYVTINHFEDFDAFLKYIPSHRLVALELPEHYPHYKDTFVNVKDFFWLPDQCLLIGEEGAGIPNDHISQCWYRVKIEIPGSMRSLNAATAAGIAMYDISYSHINKSTNAKNSNS